MGFQIGFKFGIFWIFELEFEFGFRIQTRIQTLKSWQYHIKTRIQTRKSENFSKKDDYLNISLDKHSNIYIQEIKIEKVDLIDKIKSILNEKPQIQIMIYGDQSTHYGDMIYVFSALRQASIDNVTLVTEE